MKTHSILWRRLDAPGHDACRLVERETGWRVEGTAVFRHEGTPACLSYRVDCDPGWRTSTGIVRGWVGSRSLDDRIERRPDGVWTLDGAVASGLDGCVDLDLGFTPATNLLQLRRLSLQVGRAADAPSAWFDVESRTLEELHQRYERRGLGTYWYEAPRFGYSALLRVDAAGFVETYPGLWEAERS